MPGEGKVPFHPECQLSPGQLVVRGGVSEKGWEWGREAGVRGLSASPRGREG